MPVLLWGKVKSLGRRSRKPDRRDAPSRPFSWRPGDNARSFDESAAARCRSEDGSRHGGACPASYTFYGKDHHDKSVSPPSSCHPLPRPLDAETPPTPMTPMYECRRCSSGPSPSMRSGSGSGSGSVSSISSSGSDDTPEMRCLRIAEQAAGHHSRRTANGDKEGYKQKSHPRRHVPEDYKQDSSASPSPETNGKLLVPFSSILKIHPGLEPDNTTPAHHVSDADPYFHHRAPSELSPSPAMTGYNVPPSSSPRYLRSSSGISSDSPAPIPAANVRYMGFGLETPFTPSHGNMRNTAWMEPESPTVLPLPASIRSTGTTGLESPITPYYANTRSAGVSPESTPTGGLDDRKSSTTHPLPLPPSSPTSPAEYPGQSRWSKGRSLGRGTFGRVYVGLNSETGQMCAIKEVEVISDDSNSKECLKQLRQEIDLLSQLSHPNIVQYYGSELGDDTLSIFLEYVSGGSIHRLLHDYGPLKEPLVRLYTKQILSGIAYLHGRNCIHRDIKGANILVEPNGKLKLADFGMAKHTTSCASIRSFKGSPYWMAPEVILNSRGYGFAVDIWSLGCTIVEMVTSKPPWSQHTGVQAIFKIGNSKDVPAIPEHLSEEGKGFLQLCLQRDPSVRPTAAQLMDHPFVQNCTKLTVPRTSVLRGPYLTSPSPGSPPIPESIQRINGSVLNVRDHLRKQGNEYSPTLNTPRRSHVNTKRNLSLPVSPTSSPLRQHREEYRSCIPSPTHQT